MKHKELYIYDFDDTLASTDSVIKVIKKNGETYTITSQEYNCSYKKDDTDLLDVSSCRKLVNPREIKPVTDLLKNSVKEHGLKSSVILTYRANPKPVREFLEMFKLPPIEIHTLGLDWEIIPANMSVLPEDIRKTLDDKGAWILKRINEYKIEEVYFYEDSEKYLNSVKAIKDKVPDTKITLYLVKNGQIYDF